MEIFYIALLTLVAAAIGTITRFGTSTLMIPVLVIFFPPAEAIFFKASMFGSLCSLVWLLFGCSVYTYLMKLGVEQINKYKIYYEP